MLYHLQLAGRDIGTVTCLECPGCSSERNGVCYAVLQILEAIGLGRLLPCLHSLGQNAAGTL